YDEQTSVGRRALATFPKPTIGAIRGYCLGGGLALAMQTDLRIADATSQFGIPAARLGIAYTFDGLRNLVTLVGPAHARMIMYTARRIDVTEAHRIGLINQVAAVDDLRTVVFDIAHTIAENAPLSVAASKIGIDQVVRDPEERDMD